jgi:hypothetical protein
MNYFWQNIYQTNIIPLFNFGGKLLSGNSVPRFIMGDDMIRVDIAQQYCTKN